MKKFPALHIIMFVVTAVTTLVSGALMRGVNPVSDPSKILAGLPFAFTLLTILLTHEAAHYISSRKHGVIATLPFFIPAPPFPFGIGTFGAFIKMKSPIRTREALIDIGASGPIAGFIVSVIAVIVGLSMSEVVTFEEVPGMLFLGNSLLFKLLSDIIVGNAGPGSDILLHPVAFAGWFGFFVTSMNLIPVGQLDGGHVAYAILGERHRKVSFVLVAILVLLGILFWPGWLVWAILLIILGTKHPPFLSAGPGLKKSRTMVAFISFLIFTVTFIPVPFRIVF